jgi:uncharacterized protein YciI
MAEDDRVWHLLIHTPGHRGFHAELQKAGYFVAAGPLPDRPGAGQTLVRGLSTGEITRLVVGGFLDVEVVPWHVVETAE